MRRGGVAAGVFFVSQLIWTLFCVEGLWSELSSYIDGSLMEMGLSSVGTGGLFKRTIHLDLWTLHLRRIAVARCIAKRVLAETLDRRARRF